MGAEAGYDLAVVDVRPDCAGLLLRELAPGVRVDDVIAATGTELALADEIGVIDLS